MRGLINSLYIHVYNGIYNAKKRGNLYGKEIEYTANIATKRTFGCLLIYFLLNSPLHVECR